MAGFLGGILDGGDAWRGMRQAGGTMQSPGLLGGFGDFFLNQKTQNPAFLDGLAGGLLSGNIPESMAQAQEQLARQRESEEGLVLRRKALEQDQGRFDQTFDLNKQEFDLKRQSLASQAQQERTARNATADFLERDGADPALVQMARAGQGADAYKFYMGAKKAGAAGSYGLNPVYGKDADGNIVIGQMGDDGSIVRSRTPEGFMPLGPQDTNREKAYGTGIGKSQAEGMAGLPKATASAEQMLSTIADVQNDPNRERGTGMSSVFNGIPATDGYDFGQKVDQLKGQAFLQAFESLKGAGQITEAEGQKATQAIARLSVGQSEEAFMQALGDLKGVVQAGLDRAKARAGGPGGSAIPASSSDPLGLR